MSEHDDEFDAELDKELESLSKSQDKAQKKVQNKNRKIGLILIGVLVVFGLFATWSIFSGVDSAAKQKNQVAQKQARPSAQPVKSKPVATEQQAAKETTTAKQPIAQQSETKKPDLKTASADDYIKQQEDTIEEKRISENKKQGNSTLEKMDALKTDNLNKKRQKRRASSGNRQAQRNRDKILTERMKLLFTPAGSFGQVIDDTVEPMEFNSDLIDAALESSADYQTTIKIGKNDLSTLVDTSRTPSKETEEVEDPGTVDHGIKFNVTDELTAMTHMAINTDNPSPITASILDAETKLNGAKLAGQFTSMDDAVQISFDRIVYKGKTVSCNTIALDPETRNANIADDVDTHWWKWVVFSGAALAEGYLNVSTTTTTVIDGDGDRTTQQEAITDPGRRNRAALANVGKQMLSPARSIINIPNTIHVDEYRTIKLLFLEDCKI